jgi:hypothetical protein
MTPNRLPHLGALDRWRNEVQRGERGNSFQDFDALAAAACWEACALERQAAGDMRAARDYLAIAALRLHGHDQSLGRLHEETSRSVLSSIRSITAQAVRSGQTCWLERNAARAAEYIA